MANDFGTHIKNGIIYSGGSQGGSGKVTSVNGLNGNVVLTGENILLKADGTKNIAEAFGGLTFGINGDGSYGYYKADGSFVPFSTGGEKFTDMTLLQFGLANEMSAFELSKLDAKYTLFTMRAGDSYMGGGEKFTSPWFTIFKNTNPIYGMAGETRRIGNSTYYFDITRSDIGKYTLIPASGKSSKMVCLWMAFD